MNAVSISKYHPTNNVINFAAAVRAKPPWRRKRAYEVRRASPSRGWFDFCTHAMFFEIERVADGAIAYARIDGLSAHSDAWARAKFNLRVRKYNFWCGEVAAGRFTGLACIDDDSFDLVLTPHCIELFGWGVRGELDDIPWAEDDDV